MTSKAIKYNQLKINLDDSKTPKSSNMPLITSSYSTSSKRKVLTKNYLSTTTKASSAQSDEKTSFRANVASSRSESRNKLAKFSNSNGNINSIGPSSHNNYGSLLSSKHPSNSDEYKSNNFSNNNGNFNITPTKSKKLNIFTNPGQANSAAKHFHPLSTRTNNNMVKFQHQEPINIMTLLSNQNNIPLSITALKTGFPNYETAKTSLKSMNLIRGYGVNTNQGIIRFVF
jgi:hypothetical protein